jgi:hypothetical protein
MRKCAALVLLVLIAFPASATTGGGGTLNLRDLLTNFLIVGITLADPPPDSTFATHAAHFISEDSIQFAAVQRFSNEFASQVSAYPLPSPGGGFTYSFDPELGVLTRSSESFGSVFGERSDTIGRGKFNLGINHASYTFNTLGENDLRDGDLKLVFTHEDVNRDATSATPWFEGDVLTARLYLKVESQVTAFIVNYGVTDRLDIGAAVPLVDVSVDARSDVTVQRLATGANSGIHVFPNGTSSDVIAQSGSASGVGDVALRMKYRAVKSGRGGLAFAADVRLPTGESRDLLGTGATRVGATVIGSLTAGKFSPHVNVGYAMSGDADGVEQPDELSALAGFDLAVSPRLTFAADILGSRRIDAGVIGVEDSQFTANVNPGGPPSFVTGTFPRLVVDDSDATTYLGSVGVKINPAGNLLLTVNGVFGLGGDGLKPRFAPMFGIDYSF